MERGRRGIKPRRIPASVDEAFPLGEGTADTEASVVCPYCHQAAHISLDPGSGPTQEYSEDCQVCCRPWRVVVHYAADGGAHVWIEPEDG